MKASIVRRLAVALAMAFFFLASAAALAQNAANGQLLYQQFCEVCHGQTPMAGPDRAANDPGLIRAAIDGKVPDMRVMSFLTNSNLADIAAWIASLTAPLAPPVPERDYTDLWWGGPAESGWGINIIQHPSQQIFAVMYTYDANGRATWFVLPGGTWTASNTFSGAWYRVTGKPYSQAWAPSDVRQASVATLTFTGASSGTLTFAVGGVAVTRSITRQPF
jgi:cytochrome c553